MSDYAQALAMHIFVKVYAEKTITLIAKETDTVAKLKAQLQEREGIPTEHQVLLFRGNELEDSRTLSAQHVANVSTLYLVARFAPTAVADLSALQRRTEMAEVADEATETARRMWANEAIRLGWKAPGEPEEPSVLTPTDVATQLMLPEEPSVLTPTEAASHLMLPEEPSVLSGRQKKRRRQNAAKDLIDDVYYDCGASFWNGYHTSSSSNMTHRRKLRLPRQAAPRAAADLRGQAA